MLNQQAEAKRYFTKAANLGHTHGMINVGIMELQAGNITAARTWLERAERAGDSDAALKLFAIAQMTGDVSEMRRWQHKAENAMRSSDFEMNQFNNQITNSIKSRL